MHVIDHALEFANPPGVSSLLPSTIIPVLLEASSDSDSSISLVSRLVLLLGLIPCALPCDKPLNAYWSIELYLTLSKV